MLAPARRIIGVDPGSRVTGYGVILSDGWRSRWVASGCLRLGDAPFSERLQRIFRELSRVIDEQRPEEFAIERVFVARNAASALKLGHARGAAMLAGVEAGLEVHEYAPRQIKQTVSGSGAAAKDQIGWMIGRLLMDAPERLAEDEADALAVAVCHAHQGLGGLSRHLTERVGVGA